VLRETGSDRSEYRVLAHTPEAFAAWARGLYERFAGRPIAICLEQSRGAVVYALSQFSHLVIYPILSTAAANYRATFYPSGAKSDPTDTELLFEMLERHRDRLSPLRPDTPETRKIQLLVEERRRLVDERTRWSNQLTDWLKRFFPQALQLVDNIDSPLGCDLLERWPHLDRLRSNNPSQLARFFREHGCHSEKKNQERINLIYQAVPAVTDEVLIEVGAASVQRNVRVIRELNLAIQDFDQRIEAATAAHPENDLFAHVPGAGPVMRPRLMAAFGTQRDRYRSAADLQCYSGIAPVLQQSGRSRKVHVRYACPRFLRQTFIEFAGHSIPKCQWAKAFYQHKRGQKMNHQKAVRALAFKWIRVLYACWRDRTPYDDRIYTRSLQKRNSPLSKILPTGTGWSQIAGFEKLNQKKLD
jgi:transposase